MEKAAYSVRIWLPVPTATKMKAMLFMVLRENAPFAHKEATSKITNASLALKTVKNVQV